MSFLRTALLLSVSIGLLALAGFGLQGTELALPAALAGASSLVIALG